MTCCRPSRSNLLALCVAGALFAASTPGFADSSHAPAITEARADGALLRIDGLEFAGGTPKLTLGSTVLSIVSATATHIDALLPVGVAPGSYLLTLTLAKGRNDRTDDNSKYDEFWVTIGGAGAAGKDGVAGPQGPAGPIGATGAIGPQGSQGLAGAKGDPGPQGPAGNSGPAGPAGPAGPGGKQGENGLDGKDGARGPEGPVGPAGNDGARGKDGATGPAGPPGPPGSGGGSLAAIDSLGGLPCTVAMCPGTTAFTFDPLTSLASLSCVRVPGNYTLHIQGTTSVGTKMRGAGDLLQFTSDVSGYGGTIPFRSQGQPAAFDLTTGNLCAGQTVAVTLTRFSSSDGGNPLLLQGGTCNQAALHPGAAFSVTCVVTMNGDQTLTIQ